MSQHSSRGSTYDKLRIQVLERDEYICQLNRQGCTGEATEADHIIPTSHGGPDDMDNMQASCSSCNKDKSNKMNERMNWYNTRYISHL